MSTKSTDSPNNTKKSGYTGLIGVLGIGAFFPPSAVLIAAGLIPSYVAWFTDRSRGKLTFITVVSINLAALTPLLMQLWDRGHKLNIAVNMLLSPFNWILLLAGAAVGWVVAQAFPLMVVGIITARDKARLERIRARQKMLVEEWGPAVTELPTAAVTGRKKS